MYLRLEVHDAAGNMGVYETPEPVTLDLSSPAAQLRDLRPLGRINTSPGEQTICGNDVIEKFVSGRPACLHSGNMRKYPDCCGGPAFNFDEVFVWFEVDPVLCTRERAVSVKG